MKKYFLSYITYIYRVSLSICTYGNKYPFIYLFIYLFKYIYREEAGSTPPSSTLQTRTRTYNQGRCVASHAALLSQCDTFAAVIPGFSSIYISPLNGVPYVHTGQISFSNQ